jgi:hypothetical protein
MARPDPLEVRLSGILSGLMAGYDSSKEFSSSSKGLERELFVKSFLE